MFMSKCFQSIVTAGVIILFFITLISQITNEIQYNTIMQDVQLLQQSIQLTYEAREESLNQQISELSIAKAASMNNSSEELIPVIATISEPEITYELSVGFGDIAYADIYEVQINMGYNIPAEFYYEILPETMYPLIDSVCEAEKTSGISSMFLLAVAATEVGWGTAFYEPGSNNWFNWTADARNYQTFSTTEDCVAYTKDKFQERFFNREWYAEFGQEMSDDVFTVPEVNTRYALYNDCTVNWYWSDVVCEIMYSFNSKYQEWRMTHYDM